MKERENYIIRSCGGNCFALTSSAPSAGGGPEDTTNIRPNPAQTLWPVEKPEYFGASSGLQLEKSLGRVFRGRRKGQAPLRRPRASTSKAEVSGDSFVLVDSAPALVCLRSV
jgi:hypothetical protein